MCGKHLGSFIPNPAELEDPCALSGCSRGLSTLRCRTSLLWKRRARVCPLTRLDHLKATAPLPPPQPLPPVLCQAHGPSQMPGSMFSVALHLNRKMLNRSSSGSFTEDSLPPGLGWQMERRRTSAEGAKPVLQIKVCVGGGCWY